MEIKFCMLLAIMMFILVLIVIGLAVFFTFRIEKAYITILNLDDKYDNGVFRLTPEAKEFMESESLK